MRILPLRARRSGAPIRAGLLALALGAGLARAEKSDQALASQFTALLGSGKTARMAWVKGGTNDWNNLEVPGQADNTQIYVCDSKDGARRPVASGLPTGHLLNPGLTPDGSKVVFYVGGSLEVWSCGFDGQGLKKLASGYMSFKTWRDPKDNSDWVVVLSPSKGTAYRMNLADPTQLVQLGSKLPDNGLTYAGLSKDGDYLVGGFPEAGQLGLVKVPDGAVDRSMFTPNGCWPTFSRANEDKILYTIEPHTSVRMIHRDGSPILEKNLFSGDAPGPLYNALRWSSDEDYLTYWPTNDQDKGGSPKMPVVLRLSDLKWVSLYDEATDFNGNMDLVVLSGGSTAVRVAPMGHRAAAGPAYRADGARAKAAAGARYIRPAGGER